MKIMPRKVINDYTFYKIVCLDNSVELCYVGSTADFNKRRNKHKNNCNNENSKKYNTKVYKTIRDNGGWSNFKMIELGTREQLTKRQAEQIEEEYRVALKATMNSCRCYTKEEQRQEEMKEYSQKYYQGNRDKIKELKKKYYEENRDKIKEKDKKYYQKNRDKVLEKLREKVKCECGCMVGKSSLSRHKNSPKHIKLMEIKNEN